MKLLRKRFSEVTHQAGLAVRAHGAACLVLILGCASLSTGASAQDRGFVDVNEIVDELAPLEVIANHGGVRRSIDLSIEFALASHELSETADRQIKALAEALNSGRLDGRTIFIIGHTDATGGDAENLALSTRRAVSVVNALREGYGVSRVTLTPEGRGESELIDGIAPEDPRNRRVEIRVGEAASAAASGVDTKPSEAESGTQSINW